MMNCTQRTLKFSHYVPKMKVVLSKMSVTNLVFFGLFLNKLPMLSVSII